MTTGNYPESELLSNYPVWKKNIPQKKKVVFIHFFI